MPCWEGKPQGGPFSGQKASPWTQVWATTNLGRRVSSNSSAVGLCGHHLGNWSCVLLLFLFPHLSVLPGNPIFHLWTIITALINTKQEVSGWYLKLANLFVHTLPNFPSCRQLEVHSPWLRLWGADLSSSFHVVVPQAVLTATSLGCGSTSSFRRLQCL